MKLKMNLRLAPKWKMELKRDAQVFCKIAYAVALLELIVNLIEMLPNFKQISSIHFTWWGLILWTALNLALMLVLAWPMAFLRKWTEWQCNTTNCNGDLYTNICAFFGVYYWYMCSIHFQVFSGLILFLCVAFSYASLIASYLLVRLVVWLLACLVISLMVVIAWTGREILILAFSVLKACLRLRKSLAVRKASK